MSRILIVVTSHGTLGATGKPTGFYYEELTTPYYVFEDAGHEVEIASIKGGSPPHDPASLDLSDDKRPASVKRFLQDKAAVGKLVATLGIKHVLPGKFDAIFLAGGHGTMWDFPNSEPLANTIAAIYEAGGAVAAVCHGPAGLLNVKLSNGEYLLNGVSANGFSSEEEEKAGLTRIVPFLLQDEMVQRGAKYQSGPAFKPFSTSYFRISTGQNPMSSEEVALDVVSDLVSPKQKMHAT